jgi:hypothetical protein
MGIIQEDRQSTLSGAGPKFGKLSQKSGTALRKVEQVLKGVTVPHSVYCGTESHILHETRKQLEAV